MQNFTNYYFKEDLLTYLPASSIEKRHLPEPIVQLYVDPSQYEIKKICKDSGTNGCRIAMDSLGKIYAWNENVLHNDMQKKMINYDGDNKKWIKTTKLAIKFIYTQGDNRLVTSTEYENLDSTEALLKLIPENKLQRLKLFFPDIKTIITNDKKHKVIYKF